MANLFSIPSQHMANWGDALISKNPPWKTTPEYHQWASKDLTQQKSKEIAQDHGNLAAGAFELAAPFLAGGASPLYDIPQAFHKYSEDPDKYAVNNKWDNLLYTLGVPASLEGTKLSGILNAIDMEDPLSAAWNRFLGAGKPLYDRLMNKPQNLYDVENRKNLRILNMNRRKQIMQQKIRQAEAIEAAKQKVTTGGPPSIISRPPSPPTGTGGPPSILSRPTPSAPIRTGGPPSQGGGGGGPPSRGGGSPSRGSPSQSSRGGGNPWGRAKGGRIDKALGGRSRDIG